MSGLDAFIRAARDAGASDLHLEPGLAPTLRVRGQLKGQGPPVTGAHLLDMARELLGDGWSDFLVRRSADLSTSVSGVRCRINVLHSTRGLGMAIRLLTSGIPTLTGLNLHPSVRDLLEADHGLILVTGPTGSGKTSTLAALIQELNATRARHILTIEHPVEYVFRPAQCFIRQREVGRDTPSVEQALTDAMREDPDVIVVGEMRDPATMRLTLDAAETGHLVLATMHSSTSAEALQRMVNSFAPEQQPSVCAQLADCLVGVVAQRMTWRPAEKLRVPECELMMASHAVRANIRAAQFFKLQNALDAGAAEGMWSFARYREWLERKKDWVLPLLEPGVSAPLDDEVAPVRPRAPSSEAARSAPSPEPIRPPPYPRVAEGRPRASRKPGPPALADDGSVLVLDTEAEDLNAILKDLERKR
jgi:twitching motility protein PilT